MATRVTQVETFIERAREEIEKKTGKTVEQLHEEREKRFTDVIQMKVPDRMPVYLRLQTFPVRYAGISPSAMFYDIDAFRRAIVQVLLDFEPDIVNMTAGNRSGPAMDILGAKQYQWPGGNLRPDLYAQHRDMEVMKEDEYDLFITDPGDYILRYYLPRTFTALGHLAKLPPLRSLLGATAVVTESPHFSPEIIQAFEAISKAGQEQVKFAQWQRAIYNELGFIPLSYAGSPVVTPFDVLADHLRGMNGIAVDMFRRPEKLHAAMDRILDWSLVRAVPPDSEERGRRRVSGGMAHWGSAAFLSRKQFDTFYWPTLKKSLLAAIDMGFVPVLHPEADSDDRIDCFLDLPKGKAFIWNEILDVFKAKEILGGHMAFMGGVPAALLWGGSPQEVDEYCKKLIGVVGKGGGYVLSAAGVGEENAKPENLKAMVDAVRKYGRY